MGFDEKEVRSLYRGLIEGWNFGDAAAMTRDFGEKAHVVGFDGGQENGR